MLQTFDERNRDLIVSVRGVLAHRAEAAVSPFDSAVQGGDAVWEGLRLYAGRIFRLSEHLARLRRSAQALAFTEIPSDGEITAEISRTLHANGMTDGVWGPYWYESVWRSTGFGPYRPPGGPLPARLVPLAERCLPYYERLRAYRLTGTAGPAGGSPPGRRDAADLR